MNINIILKSLMISGKYINNHGDYITRTEKPMSVDDTFTLVVQKTPRLQTRFSYSSLRVAKSDIEAYRRIHNGGRVIWTCDAECLNNIVRSSEKKNA